MMPAWKGELLAMLEPLFGSTGSPLFFGLIAAALIVYLAVLQFAAKSMDIARREWIHLVPASLLGLGLLLAGMIAVKLHVPIEFTSQTWRLPVLATVMALGLTVPVYCLVLRANYVKALFTFLMSVAAAAFAVMLITSVVNAVSSGSDSVSPVQTRKREVEDFINK